MDKNFTVNKSNKLITCNYDLSLQEQKIILTLASMVQPQDIEFKEYKFIIKDFIKLLGLKDQSKYTEVRKITKELKEKVFEINEGTDIIQVSWLGGVRYKAKEGVVILRLDPDLKPYMLALKDNFTSYKLENILSLKSKYSLRIYELLKSNQYKKGKKGWNIGIEDFKKILGATDKSYCVYQNVKNRIIIQAQNELKEKTDISFDFEEIKTGRKVTNLNFFIKLNKSQEKAQDETCVTDEGKSTNEEEKRSTGLINDIKAIFKEDIDGLEAQKISTAAKGDLNIIKEKYGLSKNVGNIGNIVGWMLKAIKDDYKTPKGKVKTGVFNDYEQRDYDFDELEKRLLGWDNDGAEEDPLQGKISI